jgi:hypothetical protein
MYMFTLWFNAFLVCFLVVLLWIYHSLEFVFIITLYTIYHTFIIFSEFIHGVQSTGWLNIDFASAISYKRDAPLAEKNFAMLMVQLAHIVYFFHSLLIKFSN